MENHLETLKTATHKPMNEINYYGLQRMYKQHEDKIRNMLGPAFGKGQYIEGKQSDKLETSLADITNRKYSVLTGSATDALFIALKSAGIKKGDEVLIPAISYISSATAITRTCAKPVFVDVHPGDALMNIEDAESKITSATKAILFVDLYGNLPDASALEEFARKHHLLLIEDAAQSIGSLRDNRSAGSIGDISVFSFDPSKPVGAFGTGGAILTDKREITDFCRGARQNGKNPNTGIYDQFGINSRMSEFQAALVNWQLETLKEQLAIRRNLAEQYKKALASLPVKFIIEQQFSNSGNFHKFIISLKYRDTVKKHLQQHGIQSRIHYENCLYQHPVLQKYKTSCPEAEKLTSQVLSLPFYPELEENEIAYICETLNSILI